MGVQRTFYTPVKSSATVHEAFFHIPTNQELKHLP